MSDIWRSAEAYEAYMGRWSKALAAQFVPWLKEEQGKEWLDVGCGTGALTQAIVEFGLPSRVVGIDPSPAFVARARVAVDDPRVEFIGGDASDLTAPGEFDVVVAGLVLNFLPDPAAGLREMAQATRRGGTVAAYVWDYAEGMELMRYFWDAAVELDPAAASQDEGRKNAICKPAPLRDLAAEHLEVLETRAITTATNFQSFDDYWRPFLGGVGSAPAYAMSLSEGKRNALRERLRARLPGGPGGSIELTARAWAVKGRRP